MMLGAGDLAVEAGQIIMILLTLLDLILSSDASDDEHDAPPPRNYQRVGEYHRRPRMPSKYQSLVEPHWQNEDYRKFLRVSKDTFLYIADAISPFYGTPGECADPEQHAVGVREALFMALLYNAGGPGFRIMENQSNRGTSTCHAKVRLVNRWGPGLDAARCCALLQPPVPSGDKRLFNKKHSRTRIIVEHAFGRLKNRWRVLLDVLHCKKMEYAIDTILACCVLHNICEERNEVPPEEDQELTELLAVWEERYGGPLNYYNAALPGNDAHGHNIRDAIMKHVCMPVDMATEDD
jgi:hypothetical protein